MRSTVRPARVVSVCVLGQPQGPMRKRLDLVRRVIASITDSDEWPDVDAVVWPAGYFSHRYHLGSRSPQERRERLADERFYAPIIEEACRLNRHSPGALLVLGTDRDASRRHGPEQVVLAFQGARIRGIARKIFPTDQDTGPRRRRMTPCFSDYSSHDRFVRLPNGETAVLAACYDLFGFVAQARTSAPIRNIRALLTSGGRIGRRSPNFRTLNTHAASAWRATVAMQKPTVILAAIHQFRRPGLEGYWQRHGIAGASAAFAGALVVGAAHFAKALPGAQNAVLAAHGVPKLHVGRGVSRRAHPLPPVATKIPAGGNVLLRLHSANGLV